MKALVTGAGGFIGRHVVVALVRGGHRVRALVRPGTDVARLPWSDAAEPVLADLSSDELEGAVDGTEAVVHLAARVDGTDAERFSGTVPPTERLIHAMARRGVGRLVLASSYSVYDWSTARGVLDERSALEPRVYERDGYAVAKWWQERVARRAADREGLDLVVLRPGFVWGPGGPPVAGAGVPLGRIQLVVGPLAALPLTYVENCAECFAAAAESARASNETFNVVDDGGVAAWRFARALRPVTGDTVLVPVPYAVGRAAAGAATALARRVLGPDARLPSVLVDRRFEARFKPLRHSAAKAESVLGWRPAVGFEEAVRRTVGALDAWR